MTLNTWEQYNPWLGDVLFVGGNNSSYIKQDYYNNIYQQFPKALICIMNAGHWIHIEKCHDIFEIIDYFLNTK